MRLLVAVGAAAFLWALLTAPTSRTLVRRKLEALKQKRPEE